MINQASMQLRKYSARPLHKNMPMLQKIWLMKCFKIVIISRIKKNVIILLLIKSCTLHLLYSEVRVIYLKKLQKMNLFNL